jgi:hypothetical protein
MADTEQAEGYSVARLRRQYLDFTGTKSNEIEEQRQARHYYHGDQFTAAELKTLRKRRQPPVTANRIGRKIDGIVGLVERMRQDPKAYSRTPEEDQRFPSEGGGESGADVSTATVRYTLDANRWQDTSSESARSGAINGIGGLELSLEKGDQGDPEVRMDVVDADTFFYECPVHGRGEMGRSRCRQGNVSRQGG